MLRIPRHESLVEGLARRSMERQSCWVRCCAPGGSAWCPNGSSPRPAPTLLGSELPATPLPQSSPLTQCPRKQQGRCGNTGPSALSNHLALSRGKKPYLRAHHSTISGPLNQARPVGLQVGLHYQKNSLSLTQLPINGYHGPSLFFGPARFTPA